MNIWDLRGVAQAAGKSMSWTVSDEPARPGSGRPASSWVVEPLEDGANSRWTIYYSEKGIDGSHEYFESEDEACRWAAKKIEEGAAAARAPIHVLTEQEEAQAAEVRRKYFEKMNIVDWK